MAQDLGFDEDDLRALAGPRSFERVQNNLAAVTAVEVGDGWITATVHGTDAYQVELALDGPDGLAGECDCPYGMQGNFCKQRCAPTPGSGSSPGTAARSWSMPCSTTGRPETQAEPDAAPRPARPVTGAARIRKSIHSTCAVSG
ncbi:SWIM zinc finger domain-containing protein [Streptomyces sp. NPDC007971]|uniref:SWIM zinc finger family protein n=1 Tax=Streptomyces sp. NPDC007971 TaxID=3364799 RepID=UPI0036E83B7E